MHEAWMKVWISKMPRPKMKLGRWVNTIYRHFVGCHSFPGWREVFQFRSRYFCRNLLQILQINWRDFELWMSRIELNCIKILCNPIDYDCCSFKRQSKVIPSRWSEDTSLELFVCQTLFEKEVDKILTVTVNSYRKVLFCAWKLPIDHLVFTCLTGVIPAGYCPWPHIKVSIHCSFIIRYRRNILIQIQSSLIHYVLRW